MVKQQKFKKQKKFKKFKKSSFRSKNQNYPLILFFIFLQIFNTCKQCKPQKQHEQSINLFPTHKQYPILQDYDREQLKINKIQNKCIIRRFQSTNNKNLQLDELQNCTIVILDTIKCITIDNSQNCHIFISACEGSVFIRNCQNIRISSISSQFRMKNCQYCSCFISVKTQPVIEQSQNIIFLPFLYSVDCQNEQQANDIIKQVNTHIENSLIYSQNLYANMTNNYYYPYDFNKNDNKPNYQALILPDKDHQEVWQQPPVISLEEKELQYNNNEKKAIYTTNGCVPIILSAQNIQNCQEEEFDEIQGIYKHIQWNKNNMICYQVNKVQENVYQYKICQFNDSKN